MYIILAFIMTTTATFANDAYEKAMKKSLTSLESAQTAEEYLEVANSFERIASIKAGEWLPLYYGSYAYLMQAMKEKDPAKKDLLLDKAQKIVENAEKLKSDDSELITLQGYIYMIRVTVDPASRGQALSGKVFSTLNRAIALNPENPRALLILGNMMYGTAQFFNGDTSEACNLIVKSKNLFEDEEVKEFYPSWGKKMAERISSQCK
jgi:hypothetical protein